MTSRPTTTPRVHWTDPHERDGWDARYTHLGARLRSIDPAAGLTGPQRLTHRRRTGQALIAVTARRPDMPAPTADADVTFFAAVARKILQRGHAPALPDSIERSILDDDVAARVATATAADWLAATVGPAPAFELDPCIELHPTYERPLWDIVAGKYPQLAPYVIPQAPLDALSTGDDGHRRVDFLLTLPWLPRAAVIELDGAQHDRARDVDTSRDRAVTAAGHAVLRYPGRAALAPGSDLLARIADAARRHPGHPDALLTRVVHGPAAAARLAYAIVELLARGLLPPGGVWQLEVDDPLDIAPAVLPAVLNILDDIATVWSLPVVPTEVRAGTGVWLLVDGSYQPANPTGAAAAQARIVLDPFTPPHAALPDHDGTPTVVIRGTHLPVDLAWQPGPAVLARSIDLADPAVDPALTRLADALFGFPGFRDGQLAAIRNVLAGQDSVVLLPTGAGKSLIYQLAGLLRPGISIVVDPITSLINDQERRLRADGIDRVAALHSARIGGGKDRDRAFTAIAAGDPLFVFLTPERLQSQAFRDTLTAAAARQVINLAVVDEAHCVSEWGHDFRTAYLRLGRNLRRFAAAADGSMPPLLALTGTASPAVLRDVVRELTSPGREMAVQRPGTFDRANLSYSVLSGTPTTLPARLRQALTEQIPAALGNPAAAGESGVVFVPHVNGGYGLLDVHAKVRDALTQPGDRPAQQRVGVYAGTAPKTFDRARGSWEQQKDAAAADFLTGNVPALVATKAFGMGIDKPDIRWTVHLGFPSSIEAFAQEAGRAGRDGAPAHCVIVATPPTVQRAHELLDLSASRGRRVAAFRRGRHDDDLQRQLYFLISSFTGIDEEYADVQALLAALLPAGPGGRVDIARGDEAHAKRQEKALYRLALVGVVADYTVEHGAQLFTIELEHFTAASIDQAVLDFIGRVEPGKLTARRRDLAAAPQALTDRIGHHVQLVLATLYAVIEPARLRALTEMYQLTLGQPGDAGIRERLLGYLTDGPLAGILTELATARRVNVDLALRELDTSPPTDPAEWVGAAARQLEAYPDHPMLLLVRAVGEALTRRPDLDLAETTAAAAFAATGPYDVAMADTVTLFDWAARQLRTQQRGRAAHLAPLLYRAWDAAGLPATALEQVERRVLTDAADLAAHPAELRAVLHRRLSASAVTAEAVTTLLTTGRDDSLPEGTS